jgi:hypothetical protein
MSLLIIDQTKVEQELARATPFYTTSCSLEIPIPTARVWNTVMFTPPEVQEARQRLMEIRRRFIESGGRLLSTEELESTINEVRGR